MVEAVDDEARIATWAGVDRATVERLQATGLVDGTADARRRAAGVRLLMALEAAGIAPATLADAVAAGDLVPGFAEYVTTEPIVLTGATFGATLAALGVEPAQAARLYVAAGLPPIEPERPVREDDVRLLHMLRAALQLGVSEDAVARVLRVFAQAARRAAEVMREVFRSEVEDRLRAAGVPPGALPAVAGARRPELQRMGLATAQLLLTRVLEDLVFENVTLQLEAALAASGRLPQRGETGHALAFADLVGFSRLTEAVGDVAAAAVATRFESLAHGTATAHGGRLVKALGDGVLLVARDAPSLRRLLLALVAAAGTSGLPALRIGAAAGRVVFRDGDVFGSAVNRAARLLAAARPGELLADRELVEGDDDAGWTPIGAIEAKGQGEVQAFALAVGASAQGRGSKESR